MELCDSAERVNGLFAHLFTRRSLVPLIAAYPGVPEYQMVLGQTYLTLGRSLVRLGRAAAAAEPAGKSYRIWQALCEKSPHHFGFKLGFAAAECVIGDSHVSAGEAEEAVRWYGRAIDGAQATLNQVGARRFIYSDLARAHAGRAAAHERAGRFTEALADWDRAIDCGEKEGGSALYLLGKASTLTRAGRPAEGEQLLVLLHRNRAKADGGVCFQAACTAALLAGAKPEESDRVGKAESLGIDFLKRADESGLFRMRQWAERLKSEPALEPLRQSPAFKDVMSRAAKGPTSWGWPSRPEEPQRRM
jgi:tetratricopeptide (TPR) repeat protein